MNGFHSVQYNLRLGWLIKFKLQETSLIQGGYIPNITMDNTALLVPIDNVTYELFTHISFFNKKNSIHSNIHTYLILLRKTICTSIHQQVYTYARYRNKWEKLLGPTKDLQLEVDGDDWWTSKVCWLAFSKNIVIRGCIARFFNHC